MVKLLEIYPEPGDRKITVQVDDKDLDQARVRVEREGLGPIETVEPLRKAAA
jgi:hypothetical protein